MTDSSGVGIEKAVVTIVNEGTGGQRQVRTDADGIYVAAELPVGYYTARFEAAGLSQVERRAKVDVASETRVDVTLSVQPVELSKDDISTEEMKDTVADQLFEFARKKQARKEDVVKMEETWRARRGHRHHGGAQAESGADGVPKQARVFVGTKEVLSEAAVTPAFEPYEKASGLTPVALSHGKAQTIS